MAQRPNDAVVVPGKGFGFPKPEGSPVCRGRKGKLTALVKDIDCLASVSGYDFVRGNLDFVREGKD
jgi:hypothetical protein